MIYYELWKYTVIQFGRSKRVPISHLLYNHVSTYCLSRGLPQWLLCSRVVLNEGLEQLRIRVVWIMDWDTNRMSSLLVGLRTITRLGGERNAVSRILGSQQSLHCHTTLVAIYLHHNFYCSEELQVPQIDFRRQRCGVRLDGWQRYIDTLEGRRSTFQEHTVAAGLIRRQDQCLH
jgi:hypothetical protein